MKIKMVENYSYWHFNIIFGSSTQKQYDYIYKHLDFDKLNKQIFLFDNVKTEQWFFNTFVNNICLQNMEELSQNKYQWLKQNFGKDIFKTSIDYKDKQELKTVINKHINIQLLNKK